MFYYSKGIVLCKSFLSIKKIACLPKKKRSPRRILALHCYYVYTSSQKWCKLQFLYLASFFSNRCQLIVLSPPDDQLLQHTISCMLKGCKHLFSIVPHATKHRYQSVAQTPYFWRKIMGT